MTDETSGTCVATGPLIPVTWDEQGCAEGRPTMVGLRTLISEAHRIVSIDLAPAPALSALLRILCAIAAAVTGLDFEHGDIVDWEERREDLLDSAEGFDALAVANYFDPLLTQGRFRLFGGSRPFGQDPRLREECASSSGVNKITVGRASGNAFSWFGHHLDARPEPVSAPEAFAGLLVWLYYGAAGRCTTRSVKGSGGLTAKSDTKAGPLRGTISYHPLAPTVYQSLLAGIPVPDKFGPRDPSDACPWERDELPDPTAMPPEAVGTRSRLTARWQHAVLLVPDSTGENAIDAYVTWAYRDRVTAPADPYLIWHHTKDKVFPSYADSSRGLWRDYDSLLLSPTIQGDGPRRPEVLSYPPEVPDLRVLALGFEQETGKAIDRQFVTSTTPPIYQYLKEKDGETARLAGSVREIAERYGRRLDLATQMARQLYTDSDKRRSCAWSRTAMARYWPAAEAEFWRILNEGVLAADRVRKDFQAMARTIYDDATRPALASVRGGEARSRARFELYGGLPKTRSGSTQKNGPNPPEPVQRNPVKTKPDTDRLNREREFVAAVRRACGDPGLQQALRVAANKHTDRRRMKVAEALDPAIPDAERVGDALKPYHVVASLIAQLPRPRALAVQIDPSADGFPRNLGRCLAQAVTRRELDADMAKRQLQRLLWASPAIVYAQLPHLIRRMPDRSDAIDYPQLLRDLRRWPTARREISERWNDDFFAELTRASARKAEADDGVSADA